MERETTDAINLFQDACELLIYSLLLLLILLLLLEFVLCQVFEGVIGVVKLVSGAYI